MLSLTPSIALLPLSEPGGGYVPIEHTPGSIRPFSAALGVVPIVEGKHRTTATKNTAKQPTQRSLNGRVIADTETVVQTDT